VLGLEEGSHHHLLDLGEGCQLTEDHHAKELALVSATLAKLEEAGTVDGLQMEIQGEDGVCLRCRWVA